MATELETPPKEERKERLFKPICGMVQVIYGPMFSGKTTELLRRVRIYRIRGAVCLLLKTKDSRYENDIHNVMTHDQFNYLEAVSCDSLYEREGLVGEADIVAIDEGQFFPDIVEFCEELANRGKIVIVACLDSDYRREPFGNICSLVAKSEQVTKLGSICRYCKTDAYFTARISAETELRVIGGLDKYVPVCRRCYKKVNE